MSNAAIDSNSVAVAMGVSFVDGTTPLPLLVNPVTGRLLVTGIVSNDTITLYSAPAARDENNVTTALVLENGTTTVRKLTTRSGYLLVTDAAGAVSNIVMEDNFYILTEDGSYLLTE